MFPLVIALVLVVNEATVSSVNGEGCSSVNTTSGSVINMCEDGSWRLGVVYVSVTPTNMGNSTSCGCTMSGEVQEKDITANFTLVYKNASIQNCVQTNLTVTTPESPLVFSCVSSPNSNVPHSRDNINLTLSRPSVSSRTSFCLSIILMNHTENNILLTCGSGNQTSTASPTSQDPSTTPSTSTSATSSTPSTTSEVSMSAPNTVASSTANASSTDEMKSSTNEMTSSTDEMTSSTVEMTSSTAEMTSSADEMTTRTNEMTSSTNEMTSNTEPSTTRKGDQEPKDNQIDLIPPTVGGVVGGSALIIIITVLIVVYTRKKRQNYPPREEGPEVRSVGSEDVLIDNVLYESSSAFASNQPPKASQPGPTNGRGVYGNVNNNLGSPSVADDKTSGDQAMFSMGNATAASASTAATAPAATAPATTAAATAAAPALAAASAAATAGRQPTSDEYAVVNKPGRGQKPYAEVRL